MIVLAKGEPMFRTALAILGNEADARNSTQQAFIASWSRMSGLRDLDRFDAWLGRILINECRMALRHRRRVREVSVADVANSALPTSPTGAANSTDFDDAFDRLSVDQRALLVLYHMHGYGVREIAAWLGIPSGTVKWRLSRARAALRRELEP